MDRAEVRSAQWARVRGRLRAEFGDGVFRSWIKPMTLVGCDAGTVCIGVPTRFLRDRVSAQYGDRLRCLWSEEDDAVREVDLVVVGVLSPGVEGTRDYATRETRHDGAPASQAGHQDRAGPQGAKGNGAKGNGAAGDNARDGGIKTGTNHAGARNGASIQIVQNEDDWIDNLSAPLDERYTFDNFVAGKPNEFAHAASRRAAEADRVPFNPLFLYGGVGLGKTHLMHAIAWHIRERDPRRRVVYLSAEAFMYQFIRAVRFRDTMAFKEQFRSVHVLMVDDVQFICGRESTQEEFFHTFNALIDQNRQIVISADKSPADLEGLEERMRSRLGWGLVADIHPTTYELRLSILEAKADQMRAKVPAQVLEFLAAKIASNVRELEGALLRLNAHAELVGRPILLDTAQEVLRDVLRANDRKVTIEEIQKRVAEHYNIRLADMHSPRRARAVARPRQVAMYLAKQLTARSLPEIGRKFGGRDHTTVIHAVRKIEELRADDNGLSEDIDLLRRMLEN